jgi:hypothetical protein
MNYKWHAEYDGKKDCVRLDLMLDAELQEFLKSGVIEKEGDKLIRESNDEFVFTRYIVKRPLGQIGHMGACFEKRLIDEGRTSFEFRSYQSAEYFAHQFKASLQRVIEEIYLLKKTIDMTVEITVRKREGDT